MNSYNYHKVKNDLCPFLSTAPFSDKLLTFLFSSGYNFQFKMAHFYPFSSYKFVFQLFPNILSELSTPPEMFPLFIAVRQTAKSTVAMSSAGLSTLYHSIALSENVQFHQVYCCFGEMKVTVGAKTAFHSEEPAVLNGDLRALCEAANAQFRSLCSFRCLNLSG